MKKFVLLVLVLALALMVAFATDGAKDRNGAEPTSVAAQS